MEAMEEKMIRGLDRLLQFDDVLVNVLSKLPVKNLLRFRCVCKRWLYIISEEPLLTQLHSHQSKSKPHLVFLPCPSGREDKTQMVTSTDWEGNSISRFEFKIGRHLDLKLLRTHFDLVCIYDSKNIGICNPSTHESITLPPLPPMQYFPNNVGFGYVESTDEYKVVCLISPYNRDLVTPATSDNAASFTTKCQVFTLGSSTSSSSSWAWRDVMDYPYLLYHREAVFTNGALHWLVYYNPDIETKFDPENTIVAFDLESEEFRLLPHPKGFPDLRSFSPCEILDIQLVELRGLLCLFYPQYSKLDIWMLKNYESGIWIKEYSIDMIAMGYNGYYGSLFTPRDIDNTKVLLELKYSRGTILGYYDLHSLSFKAFVHPKKEDVLCVGRWPQFSFYVESLRSLKQLKVIKASVEAKAEAEAEAEAAKAYLWLPCLFSSENDD